MVGDGSPVVGVLALHELPVELLLRTVQSGLCVGDLRQLRGTCRSLREVFADEGFHESAAHAALVYELHGVCVREESVEKVVERYGERLTVRNQAIQLLHPLQAPPSLQHPLALPLPEEINSLRFRKVHQLAAVLTARAPTLASSTWRSKAALLHGNQITPPALSTRSFDMNSFNHSSISLPCGGHGVGFCISFWLLIRHGGEFNNTATFRGREIVPLIALSNPSERMIQIAMNPKSMQVVLQAYLVGQSRDGSSSIATTALVFPQRGCWTHVALVCRDKTEQLPEHAELFINGQSFGKRLMLPEQFVSRLCAKTSGMLLAGNRSGGFSGAYITGLRVFGCSLSQEDVELVSLIAPASNTNDFAQRFSEQNVHEGFGCDYCNEYPLRGTLWHCRQCYPSYDLCTLCISRVMHQGTLQPPARNSHQHSPWHTFIPIFSATSLSTNDPFRQSMFGTPSYSSGMIPVSTEHSSTLPFQQTRNPYSAYIAVKVETPHSYINHEL